MIQAPKSSSYSDVGKRIQAGDACVFNDFFHQLYAPVYTRALKVLKNHHDADEAAQDVFVRLWGKKSKWNASGGTFMGWFLTLAERTIIDAYRKKQGQLKKETEYRVVSLDYELGNAKEDVQTLLERVPDRQPEALRMMVSDEILRRIETAALSVRKRHYRLAWILRHLEGYSPAEIARIMGSPVGTCKIWIHRCQKEIRATLAEMYSES